MPKTIAYSADYSRTNLASKIRWSKRRPKIENCEPFIDFIRCDSGSEYKFLHADKGEVLNDSLFMFEPVLDQSDGNYFLCYSADFEVIDSPETKEFLDALKRSKGQVEIVLGFRDLGGEVLVDCYEEHENRTVKMTKT